MAGIVLTALVLSWGVTGLGLPSHASGDPVVRPGVDPTNDFIAEVGQEFIDNQRILGEFKGWILEQPGVEQSGYIDQVNDAAHLATRLLWFGDDPLKAAALDHASSLGIEASVEQRPQPLSAINSTSARIFDRSGERAAAGFALSSVVGVQAESSTIQVEGELTSLSGSPDDIVRRLSEIAGAPVSIVIDHRVDLAIATRWDDSSPFYAGGYMKSSHGLCSSGFAARYASANHATTARHCNPGSGGYTARGGWASYGVVIATTADAALNVLSGTGAGRTFDNEWNNGSGFSKSVLNVFTVGLNDRICTSGGNSGVNCNVKVTAMSVYIDDGHGYFSTIRGVQQNAAHIAAIQGDSGGPVLMPYGGSWDQRVGAVGILQAVENGASGGCGSVHDAGSNLCSRTVLFSSIQTALIHGGLHANLVSGG
ncbi:hypothetical protein [Herbiconiux sp. VKM Ac-2851]|uniref:hypothetical protein n=1 Tax=Herbiconiux sp. VKM Ac-2851 TaxID=2739025 RepID=UPI0015658E51|nr:hypothetical protein [Herbiconiux sp. VKM Ac-2851]NQX35069.1 hypothetical protein [Herbiconiux sp. VKM Ac-2851]